MRRLGMLLGPLAVLGALGLGSQSFSADGEDTAPPGFAPLAHLVGGWRGTAVPPANRLKGWSETHRWGWKFNGGKPVALTWSVEGGKGLAQGVLSYDAASKVYTLKGTNTAKSPLTYTGTIDDAGKFLTLDREGGDPAQADGKERLIIRVLPENTIRYNVFQEKQAPGAIRYARMLDVGLTREGEAFAAGAGASDLPKCIVTGGAATLRVTYQGKTFPLCCSGCQEEFNDNPEKYVKKAALLASKAPAGKASETTSAPSRGKDDGSFDAPAKGKMQGQAKTAAKSKTEPAKKSAETEESAPATKDKPKDIAARAASLTRVAQALERAGKTSAAIDAYKKVVAECPDTPEAKTAAERIRKLGG